MRVTNFRSIAECDVELGALTVLAGFNAAGKSNILDALRLVADAMRSPLDHVISTRGGMRSVLRQGEPAAGSFSVSLDLNLPLEQRGMTGSVSAQYEFEIGFVRERPIVLRERCVIDSLPDPQSLHIKNGEIVNGDHLLVRLRGNRSDHQLQLPAAALLSVSYAQMQNALAAMCFYELDSDTLRALDEETVRQQQLGPSGQHLGHVLGDLAEHSPTSKERLDAYLRAIVPNALGVDERREGRYSTVQARFRADDEDAAVFQREAMSEGTLRAAGVLAALFQQPVRDHLVPLLAIEEPEVAIHPSTVSALYEALTEAAEQVQVVVTTQSSDILDSEEADISQIRAVANVQGATVIGPVDTAGTAAVTSGLMSLSGLHRSGQMLPAQIGYPVEDRS